MGYPRLAGSRARAAGCPSAARGPGYRRRPRRRQTHDEEDERCDYPTAFKAKIGDCWIA